MLISFHFNTDKRWPDSPYKPITRKKKMKNDQIIFAQRYRNLIKIKTIPLIKGMRLTHGFISNKMANVDAPST